MLKKKNIAMAMAAATVVTAAPAYAAPVQRDVIDTTQEKEIKELKDAVLAKYNTKYTKNEALANGTNGECVYEITIEGVNTKLDSYAKFEAAFDKLYKELKNGEQITVSYTSENTKFRVLEDEKTVVNFEDNSFAGITKDGGLTDSDYTKKLGKIVYGEKADKTAYAKIPVTDGYITVENGDVELDLTHPIFKVEDGNYVDANGNAIKAFNEESVVADAKNVFEKGGVIEGYYRTIGKTDELKADKGTHAIVKKASSAQKEDVTVADLYEASTDRLTKKGNELRKTLAATETKTDKVADDVTLVKSVFGINKAGEVCKLDDANLAEIKVVFEERKNEISEWVPVYEMTITEVRDHKFDIVKKHILGTDSMVNGMDLAAGLDRYETSVELSKKGWDKADTVVLVSGANDKLVDGLTATPLAAQLDAPVLLAKKDSIPANVIDEIERLGAKNVYIVGGESAVSKEVANLLTTKYSKNVTRLAGDSRYETSNVVAEELLAKKGGDKFDEIFVVGGKGEADALSISAIAGVKKSPVLLTPAANLDKDVEGFLKANLADTLKDKDFVTNVETDCTDIFVVGGENSVSKKVQADLATIAGTHFEIERLAGEGRQETNAAVIDRFATRIDLDGNSDQEIGVVVGKSHNAALVDSLSAGAYAAKTGAHIVLATNELTNSQKDSLDKVNTWNDSLSNVVKNKTQAGYGIAEKVAAFIKGL